MYCCLLLLKIENECERSDRTRSEEKVAILLTPCLCCYRARTTFWLRFAQCIFCLCTSRNFDYMAISVNFMRTCQYTYMCEYNYKCVCVWVCERAFFHFWNSSSLVWVLSFRRFVSVNVSLCLCFFYQIVSRNGHARHVDSNGNLITIVLFRCE